MDFSLDTDIVAARTRDRVAFGPSESACALAYGALTPCASFACGSVPPVDFATARWRSGTYDSPLGAHSRNRRWFKST